ncbi:hypothetical protein G6F64_014270 [Rhizopus arrhizus]|uniref:Ribonucleotide reductase large subunit C-terminal domain-containing protein n=1 Tax=Rhizopus oryzae TaxID=64495 RepID=A0A9P7BJI0_RHIOR|nr:hypothetical protein G6F64_014270 [Rhizopus arrhizus]
MVYSSNLCTEILQNMSPTRMIQEIVSGAQIVTTRRAGDFVVCNLSSINLGRAISAHARQRDRPQRVAGAAGHDHQPQVPRHRPGHLRLAPPAGAAGDPVGIAGCRTAGRPPVRAHQLPDHPGQRAAGQGEGQLPDVRWQRLAQRPLLR